MSSPLFKKPFPLGRAFFCFTFDPMRRYTFLIALLTVAVTHRPARAQDSIPLPPSHSFFTLAENDLQEERFTFVDTGLSIVDQYRLRPSYNLGFGQYRLTNLTQPYQETVFKLPYKIGAYLGQTALNDLYDDPARVGFYNVRTPYTDLAYRSSYNVGGGTHVLHTQNIMPQWNIAVGYNRIRSVGFYPNDEAVWNQFRLTTQYSGLKYRLRAYASLVRHTARQHGGLAQDTVFTDNTETDRTVVPVNLYSAEHRYRHFQIGLAQSYRIGGYKIIMPENDTIPDTVFVSKVRAFHRMNWTRQIFAYEDTDPNPDYYGASFIDTAATLDSTYFSRLHNSAGLSWEGYKGLGLSAGLTHEIFQYGNTENILSNGTNIRLFGNLKFKLPFATLSAKVVKGLAGPDAANTFFGGTLESTVGDSSRWKWSAYGDWQLLTPGKFYGEYRGNHDQWQRDLYSFNVIRFGGAIGRARPRRGNELLPDRLEVHYTGMQNTPYWAYVDTATSATSSDRFESVLQFKAVKGFHFGILRWDNEVMYQAIDAVSLALPDIVLRSSLYVDTRIFENKPLHVQFGATVNYTTSFNGNAYRPSVATFLRQDDVSIGNYPFIDLFLNAQVRELSAFITLEHVNAGWFDYRYFTAPHYPTNDLVLRFGLRWSFYN